MKVEKHQLPPFKSIPKTVKYPNLLLKARSKLVQSKSTIRLSLKGTTELVQIRSALM